MRGLVWNSLIVLALACGVAQAADPDPVQLAGACQGCHGVTGQGGNGIPTIVRQQNRAEFVAMMQAFRGNQRPATVMGRIARGYTDAEFAALATHFARPQ